MTRHLISGYVDTDTPSFHPVRLTSAKHPIVELFGVIKVRTPAERVNTNALLFRSFRSGCPNEPFIFEHLQNERAIQARPLKRTIRNKWPYFIVGRLNHRFVILVQATDRFEFGPPHHCENK